MAKLYAELTSDKGGRVASKGGDEYINVKLQAGNRILGHVELKQNKDGTTIVAWHDSQMPFGSDGRSKLLQLTNGIMNYSA